MNRKSITSVVVEVVEVVEVEDVVVVIEKNVPQDVGIDHHDHVPLVVVGVVDRVDVVVDDLVVVGMVVVVVVEVEVDHPHVIIIIIVRRVKQPQ